LICIFPIFAELTRWHQLENGYNFETYKNEYNKIYGSESEHAFRKIIFENNLRTIIAHNKGNKGWKLGVNHMADWSDDEFKSLMGVRKELVYLSRKHEAENLPAPSNPELLKGLPDSVDWRTKGVVTPVKDQGRCGSCWSFASAETLESFYAISSGKLVELSEQNILDCTSNPHHCGGTGGCGGATAELAFETAKTKGIATEWTYPYISYWGKNYQCQTQPPSYTKIKSYVTLPANQQDPLMMAVATLGPIAISVDASSWKFYETGVFDGCNQTFPDIDHAVQLVGYGTDSNQGNFWLVRNSWNLGWGEKGYIRIKREATPRCGTDITPSDGTGCDDGPNKVTVCGTCGILYDSAYPIF